MAFFAFFVPCHNSKLIALLTLVGSGFAAFLLATAFNSPSMLFGQDVGGSLTVSSDHSIMTSHILCDEWGRENCKFPNLCDVT